MNIGFVLDDGLDAPDGVQQYVLTLGSWLTSQGHNVHYLVGQTRRKDIPNIHSLSRNVRVSFNRNRLSIPFSGSRKQIYQLLEREHFDVLHVQMPYSPQLAGKIIKLASPTTAVVGTFHILPYGQIQSFGSWFLSKVVAATLRRFDAVLAVSTAAQAFADKAMNIKTEVVPNAVKLATFGKGQPLKKFNDGRQNIIFLGRLVERKGCLELLKAVKLLVDQNKFSNARLIIAGQGPQRAKIETYVMNNDMAGFVEMIGWITEDEKPDYLASADIAVFPSLSGESFGIVLVEAIAAGAGVVLGGDNPGYAYVLEDTPGALVDPSDTTVFAAKLSSLLGDAKLRTSLHKTQKRRIQNFDVDAIGRQVEAVYLREIAKRRHNVDNGTYE